MAKRTFVLRVHIRDSFGGRAYTQESLMQACALFCVNNRPELLFHLVWRTYVTDLLKWDKHAEISNSFNDFLRMISSFADLYQPIAKIRKSYIRKVFVTQLFPFSERLQVDRVIKRLMIPQWDTTVLSDWNLSRSLGAIARNTDKPYRTRTLAPLLAS